MHLDYVRVPSTRITSHRGGGERKDSTKVDDAAVESETDWRTPSGGQGFDGLHHLLCNFNNFYTVAPSRHTTAWSFL